MPKITIGHINTLLKTKIGRDLQHQSQDHVYPLLSRGSQHSMMRQLAGIDTRREITVEMLLLNHI
jgi:hypothetical protein